MPAKTTKVKEADAPANLPLPQYFSAQCLLACFLIASLALLPQSTLFSISPAPVTSLDRPEPAWLRSLTSDPAKTVVWDVIGVSACMLWWAPSMRSWWSPSKSLRKEERVQETLHRMAGASIATLIASALIGSVLIVMGASMQDLDDDSQILLTSVFSLHLGILGVWPVVYALGNSVLVHSKSSTRYTVTRLFAFGQCETSLERAFAYPVFGLLAGAALGCIAFPLDWDRPWQTYPLPPLVGSTVGYIAGGMTCWMRSVLHDA